MQSPITRHCPGRLYRLPTLLVVTICCLASATLHAQTAPQFYTQGAEAYNKGDTEGAKHKLQLALEVDKNFRPASVLLNRMALEARQAAAPVVPGMSAKVLERTVVPVEFSNKTLNSALEYIRQKALDDSGGKVAINFAVNLPPDLAMRRVTLKMDHVPVMQMLRYIGEMTGVNFDRQPFAIVVSPAGTKPAEGAVAPPASPAS